MRKPQGTARRRMRKKTRSCPLQKEQDAYFLRVDTRNYLRSLRLEDRNSVSRDGKGAPGVAMGS